MDPESGESIAPGPGGGVLVDDRPSAIQLLIRAFLARIRQGITVLTRGKGENIGVENRFYYDETEKVWKLRGGETEQERRESEAIRFHTSRGLASGGLASGDPNAPPPPPPPTGGPVTQARYTGVAPPPPSAALAHPVYAPAGYLAPGTETAGGVAPPPSRTAAAPPLAPQVRSSPFGAPPAAAAPAPLTSPFGVQQSAAAAENPPPQFQAAPAEAAAAAPGMAGPLASPFQASSPGGPSPLAVRTAS
eukprot:gnl/TRDRNA2_/TRDRNA2_190741_c0_seq1.p1 gnl/TRDRNA2_/TRDRNA2_190741_c0~~gnl/TRDRNA2_/TRDRNA2_190741_c0_seq1.p1  ORF type:complete len:267 (+),score=48.63 gnl/TRDRNA2_/TRDRNA2_190741_c0_seq1:60-803(+)